MCTWFGVEVPTVRVELQVVKGPCFVWADGMARHVHVLAQHLAQNEGGARLNVVGYIVVRVITWE